MRRQRQLHAFLIPIVTLLLLAGTPVVHSQCEDLSTKDFIYKNVDPDFCPHDNITAGYTTHGVRFSAKHNALVFAQTNASGAPFITQCPFNSTARGPDVGMFGPRDTGQCIRTDLMAASSTVEICDLALGNYIGIEVADPQDSVFMMCPFTDGTGNVGILLFILNMADGQAAMASSAPPGVPLLEPCLAVDPVSQHVMVVSNPNGERPRIEKLPYLAGIFGAVSSHDAGLGTLFAAASGIASHPQCGWDPDTDRLVFVTHNATHAFAWSHDRAGATTDVQVTAVGGFVGPHPFVPLARMPTSLWATIHADPATPTTGRLLLWNATSAEITFSGVVSNLDDAKYPLRHNAVGAFLATIPSLDPELLVLGMPGMHDERTFEMISIYADATPNALRRRYTVSASGVNATRLFAASTVIDNTVMFAERPQSTLMCVTLLEKSSTRAAITVAPNPITHAIAASGPTPVVTNTAVAIPPSTYAWNNLHSPRELEPSTLFFEQTLLPAGCGFYLLNDSALPRFDVIGNLLYWDGDEVGSINTAPGYLDIRISDRENAEDIWETELEQLVDAVSWGCDTTQGGLALSGYNASVATRITLSDGRGLCSHPATSNTTVSWHPGRTDTLVADPPEIVVNNVTTFTHAYDATLHDAHGVALFPLSLVDPFAWSVRDICLQVTLATTPRVFAYDTLAIKPGTVSVPSGPSHAVALSSDATSLIVDGDTVGSLVHTHSPSSALTICMDHTATTPIPPSVVSATLRSIVLRVNSTLGGIRTVQGVRYWQWDANRGEHADRSPPNVVQWTATVSTVRCGNAIREEDEACDDGDTIAGNGCSNDCRVEAGFTCDLTVEPNVCQRSQLEEGPKEEEPLFSVELEPASSTAVTGYLLVVVGISLAIVTVYKRRRNRDRSSTPGFTRASPLVKVMRDHSLLGIVFAAPGDPFSRVNRSVALVMQLLVMIATAILVLVIFEDTEGSIMNVLCTVVVSSSLSLLAGPGLLQTLLRLRVDGEFATPARKLARPVALTAAIVWCAVLLTLNVLMMATGASILPGEYAAFHRNVIASFLSAAVINLVLIEPAVIFLQYFAWRDVAVWGATTKVAPSSASLSNETSSQSAMPPTVPPVSGHASSASLCASVTPSHSGDDDTCASTTMSQGS